MLRKRGVSFEDPIEGKKWDAQDCIVSSNYGGAFGLIEDGIVAVGRHLNAVETHQLYITGGISRRQWKAKALDHKKKLLEYDHESLIAREEGHACASFAAAVMKRKRRV